MVQRSVLDKVSSVQLKMAEQRRELSELRRCLSETDTRVTSLSESFHALSDELAQLDSQMAVERYLEAIIDKLIRYGRAIRLVVCYVDPASTGDPRPSSRPGQAGHHAGCPLRSVTRSENVSFHPVSKLSWELKSQQIKWFIEPTRILNPNDISIGSTVCAQLTAECHRGHVMVCPSPQNCPFLWGGLDAIHGSFSLPEPTTQTESASRSVHPFLHSSRQIVVGHARALPSPSNCPPHRDLYTPI